MDSRVDSIKAETDTASLVSNIRPDLWHEKTREIIKMRLEFPNATNTELAKLLNVSREWVRLVLSRANLPTHAQSEYCEVICAGCGIKFRKKKGLVERLRAKGQVRFYHNKKCLDENFRRYVKIPPKRKWDYEAVYELRIEKNWGSIRISRKLGIPTATVEYILKKGNLSHGYQRRDYEVVYKLRRERGWGCVKIGRELGIPISTVKYILKKGHLARKQWKATKGKELGSNKDRLILGSPPSTSSLFKF